MQQFFRKLRYIYNFKAAQNNTQKKVRQRKYILYYI